MAGKEGKAKELKKRQQVRGLRGASDFLGVGKNGVVGKCTEEGRPAFDFSEWDTWAVLRASLHWTAPDSRESCWHLINVIICMTANDSNFAQLFEGLGGLASFLEIDYWQLAGAPGFLGGLVLPME